MKLGAKHGNAYGVQGFKITIENIGCGWCIKSVVKLRWFYVVNEAKVVGVIVEVEGLSRVFSVDECKEEKR